MRHKNRRCAAAPLDGATAAVALVVRLQLSPPNTKEMCNKEVGYTLLLGSQYCSVNFLCRFLAMHRDVIFQKYVLQYSNSTGRKSGKSYLCTCNALKVFRVHLRSMGVIVRSVHREGYGRGSNVSLSGSIDFPQKIVKR